jgi:hypothetical protein
MCLYSRFDVRHGFAKVAFADWANTSGKWTKHAINAAVKTGFCPSLSPLRERAKITWHFAEVGQTPRAPFSKFGVRPENLIKQGSDPTENGCTRRLTQNHHFQQNAK